MVKNAIATMSVLSNKNGTKHSIIIHKHHHHHHHRHHRIRIFGHGAEGLKLQWFWGLGFGHFITRLYSHSNP